MVRGFTVIEVLVTLVIMSILLGLGTVGIRASLVNGRDAERAADIEIIARGLEAYYNKGNARVKTAAEYAPGGYYTKNTYPGANEFTHIQGNDWCSHADLQYVFTPCVVAGGYVGEALPGVTDAAMTPPDKSSVSLVSNWFLNDTAIQDKVNEGNYVYVALTSDNTICYGGGLYGTTYECPRYELRYKKESTGETIVVRSKHQ